MDKASSDHPPDLHSFEEPSEVVIQIEQVEEMDHLHAHSDHNVSSIA